MTGLLLFAHGARDPGWAAPFEDIARRIRSRAPSLRVELAFLEFMSPTLAQAGRDLAAAGCERVVVVPLFLGVGGHVRKDLPALLAALASQYPQVRWQLQPAIGEIDAVVEAMAQAVFEMALRSDEAP
jgi:sirohydrochlorin cobaltochelatase